MEKWIIATKDNKKKGARMKIQPRFKIQYPMKNRGKFTGLIFPGKT